MKKIIIILSAILIIIVSYSAVIFVSAQNLKTFIENNKNLGNKNADINIEELGEIAIKYNLKGYKLSIDAFNVSYNNKILLNNSINVNNVDSPLIITNSIFKPFEYKIVMPNNLHIVKKDSGASNEQSEGNIILGEGSLLRLSIKSFDDLTPIKFKANLKDIKYIVKQQTIFEMSSYYMIINIMEAMEGKKITLYNYAKEFNSNSPMMLIGTEIKPKLEELNKKFDKGDIEFDIYIEENKDESFLLRLNKFDMKNDDGYFKLNGDVSLSSSQEILANVNINISNLNDWLKFYQERLNVFSSILNETDEYKDFAIQHIRDEDIEMAMEIFKFLDPSVENDNNFNAVLKFENDNFTLNNKSFMEVISGVDKIFKKYYPEEGGGNKDDSRKKLK